MTEFNPLVQRVDALLKRHQQQSATPEQPLPPIEPPPATVLEVAEPPPLPELAAMPDPEDDLPVLTEVVEPDAGPAPVVLSDALIAQIEAAVLERVLAAVDTALDERLGRAVADLVARTADGLRADLSASVREISRETVSTAVAQALAARSRPV